MKHLLMNWKKSVMEIQKEIPDFRYSISSPFLNIKPLDTSLNSPIMIAMKKASDDILGFHTIKAFPGSTDAPNSRTYFSYKFFDIFSN